MFCKQIFDRLCPANKFTQDLRDDHDRFQQFSPEKEKLHRIYVQLYPNCTKTM